MRTIRTLLDVAFRLSLLVAFALFILGPNRTLLRLTAGFDLERQLPLLCFFLSLAALTLYLWRATVDRILHFRNGAASFNVPAPPYNALQKTLCIGLLAILFARTVSQIDVPLDWDEHEHASMLGSPDRMQVLTPLRSENHVIANLSALASMSAFGYNKIAARIPSLVYGALFLIGLYFLLTQSLRPEQTGFILGVLALNPMVIYSLHQMRGYAPLFTFTTAALGFAMAAIYREDRKATHLWGFGLTAFFSLFSHTFGGLFLGMLFLSLTIHLYRNRARASRSQLLAGHRILMILTVLLALFALLSLFILSHLNETGFTGRTDPIPEWLRTLMLYRPFTIFGMVRLWEIKLLVVLIALCVLIQLGSSRGKEALDSWIASFLLVLALFFAIIGKLIHFTVVEGRMLQPFLILFLWFLVSSLFELKRGWVRNSLIGLSFLLLTLPSRVHRDNDDGVVGFFAETEHFYDSVKVTLSQYPDHCLSYSGDPNSVRYYRYFYFRGRNEGRGCAHPFHLFIGNGLFDRTATLPPEISTQGVMKLTDGKGRSLYELISPSKTLGSR